MSRYGDVYANRVTGERAVVLRAAERTTPAGTRHDWWNAGDRDADVLVALSPAEAGARFETMIATLCGLANAGRTNAKGLPNPLQLSLIAREFADEPERPIKAAPCGPSA